MLINFITEDGIVDINKQTSLYSKKKGKYINRARAKFKIILNRLLLKSDNKSQAVIVNFIC